MPTPFTEDSVAEEDEAVANWRAGASALIVLGTVTLL